MEHWLAARNHFLAMIALALGIGAAVALVDPGIASALALPAAFFSALAAGARFAGLAGRAMQRGEALRLAAVAVAVQLVIGLVVLVLSLAREAQPITEIHYGTILVIAAVTVLLTGLVTLAGLRFGSGTELRRRKRLQDAD